MQNIPVAANDPSVLLVPMISGMDFLYFFDCKIFSGELGSNLFGPPIDSDLPAIGSFPFIADSIY